MPPYIIGGTSASGPINQLMSFEQSDRNPSGIGHGLCAVDYQLHCPVYIELSPADQPLDLDDGGEPLLVHLTLLHRECVGQKLLESIAIEAGINKHIRGAAIGCLHLPDGLVVRMSQTRFVTGKRQFLIDRMHCQWERHCTARS